jgi:hypothetical protein
MHLFAELGHFFAKPLDTLVFHFSARNRRIDYPDFSMRPLLPHCRDVRAVVVPPSLLGMEDEMSYRGDDAIVLHAAVLGRQDGRNHACEARQEGPGDRSSD